MLWNICKTKLGAARASLQTRESSKIKRTDQFICFLKAIELRNSRSQILCQGQHVTCSIVSDPALDFIFCKKNGGRRVKRANKRMNCNTTAKKHCEWILLRKGQTISKWMKLPRKMSKWKLKQKCKDQIMRIIP